MPSPAFQLSQTPSSTRATACSSFPTDYGVRSTYIAYGIAVTSLTGYTYTRQISSESSAIQYSFDLVSRTWAYPGANEESVVLGLSASPDCLVDPSLDGKNSFSLHLQTLPLHQVTFGKAQTLSRRTPIVKVAGWKALLAENLCVYPYAVPCLSELTLPPPHERTVHVARKIQAICRTKSNNLARYNGPSPEQAPSSLFMAPPGHIAANNHKSSNIFKPSATCVQALKLIRQELQR